MGDRNRDRNLDNNTKLFVENPEAITPEIMVWAKTHIDPDARIEVEKRVVWTRKGKQNFAFIHFTTISACNTFLHYIKGSSINAQRPKEWVESQKSKKVMTVPPPPMVGSK